MDADVEKLHVLLLDTKLPSTIHELRNPTEEFIMNLITTFLKWFKIDVNLINKPTFEQQDALTCLEDNDIIISIINLYVVMRQICDRIFLPEFYISDITSSGSKKVRKFARYLANFILYATNKESDMEFTINEIHNKGRLLEELQKRTMETLNLKRTNEIIISKKLFAKKECELEIQKLQLLIESNTKTKIELGREMINVKEERQKAVEDHSTHKLESQRYDKAIADLESEVVNTPEKFHTRLHNLEEQNKATIEKREHMQDTFVTKNQLVKKYENILSFVQKTYEKCLEIKNNYEHLKKENIQGENNKEQVDSIKNNINELIKKCEMLDQKGDKMNEIHAQATERLTALRELHAQLLSDMKLGAAKLEENQVLYNDSYTEKIKIQSLIEKTEEQTSIFIKECQERYNNEVLNEINLQTSFKNAWEGLDNSKV